MLWGHAAGTGSRAWVSVTLWAPESRRAVAHFVTLATNSAAGLTIVANPRVWVMQQLLLFGKTVQFYPQCGSLHCVDHGDPAVSGLDGLPTQKHDMSSGGTRTRVLCAPCEVITLW